MKYIHKSKQVVSFRHQIAISDLKEGGLVSFQDGSLVLILKCSALNLALMSQGQQETILSIYKELLDFMQTDCQILVRLRPASVLNEKKEVLTWQKTLPENQVFKRNFYFILRSPKLETPPATWQLRLKAQSLSDHLGRLGLQVRPLSLEELANFYFQSFNPFSSLERQTLFRQDLNQALKQKENDWSKIVSYPFLTEEKDYLKIGPTFAQTLFIEEYPDQIELLVLSALIDGQQSLDLSYQLRPVANRLALSQLAKKVTELESQKRIYLKSGQLLCSQIMDPLQAASELRAKLLRGQETLYQLGIYITLVAESLLELRKKKQGLVDLLGSKLWQAKVASFRQLPAWQASLPLETDDLADCRRNLQTSALACTFPFSSLELVDEKGFFYGLNRANRSLVILDRFALANANSFICAQSGAGKSYLAKLEILRAYGAGLQIIVIDPEGEYQTLCQKLGGQYISLNQKSPYALNPLKLNKILNLGWQERIPTVLSIIEKMVGELSPQQRALLDQALLKLYARRKRPQLADLYRLLEKTAAQDICLPLEKFVKGSLSGLFSGQTPIDLDRRLTVFNLQPLSPDLRSLVMMIIANLVSEHVLFKPQQRLLFIDEAWLLLKDDLTQAFLEALIRRARKYYLGVTLISQQLADFYQNKEATALLSQASLRIFLRQDSSQMNVLRESVDLSSFEQQFLTTAGVGEALFLADNLHLIVQVLASPSEHPLITTRPREVYH